MVAKKKKSTKAKKSKKSTKKKTAVKKKSTTKKAVVKKKRTTSKKKTTVKKKKPAVKKKKATVKKSIKKKTTRKTSKKKTTASSKAKKKNYSEVDNNIMTLLSSQPDHMLYFALIKEKFGFSDEGIKKALKRLENKSPPKITTKLVMEKSRWITQIKKVEDYGLVSQNKKKASKLVWDTANDLPCFICPYIQKCSDGQELYNPKSCAYLTDWLISTLDDTSRFTGNPFHPDYTSKKSRAEAKKALEAKEKEEAEAKKVLEAKQALEAKKALEAKQALEGKRELETKQ